MKDETGGTGAADENADVPDPGIPTVGIAMRLDGTCQPTETRHRMKTRWIAPGRISKETEGETSKPNRIGG
jgi:hypothetical protein